MKKQNKSPEVKSVICDNKEKEFESNKEIEKPQKIQKDTKRKSETVKVKEEKIEQPQNSESLTESKKTNDNDIQAISENKKTLEESSKVALDTSELKSVKRLVFSD